MSGYAKRCKVCDLAFSTGQELLVHFIQHHRKQDKKAGFDIQTDEWYITADTQPATPTSIASNKGVFGQDTQEVQYISTTPRPKAIQTARDFREMSLKCPISACFAPFSRLDKLSEHFQSCHSFNCSFPDCPTTFFSPIAFINHVQRTHMSLQLPTKRRRSP
jgi:hypothetical protein